MIFKKLKKLVNQKLPIFREFFELFLSLSNNERLILV